VLGQQVRTARSQRVTKRQRGDDDVIELPDDWNEVRHQVDWNREIDDKRKEGELSTARNPIIADQATQQHQAVRNEADERTSFHPSTRDEQSRDQCDVQKESGADADEQPLNG
jgi:hypothetical protein